MLRKSTRIQLLKNAFLKFIDVISDCVVYTAFARASHESVTSYHHAECSNPSLLALGIERKGKFGVVTG